MQIKQITFTNKNGDAITINKTGSYRLTDKLQTSGLSTQAYTTKSYMQHGQTFFNSVYDSADMGLNFMIMKPVQDKDSATYLNKITSSTVENPHIVKNVSNSVINSPDMFGSEVTQLNYQSVNSLNGINLINSNSTTGYYSMTLFSFNIIQYLERKYGTDLWNGKTSIADKIVIAKQILTRLTFNWYGYGLANGSNKASISGWYHALNSWQNTKSHTNSSVSNMFFEPSLIGISNMLDPNGFVHFIAYSEAYSTSVSTIYTDYVQLDITVDTEIIEMNARKYVSKLFSPHLGQGSLTVTLQDGTYYVRDCTVDVAPFFPTGFNNSNNKWQNVIVELVANNPFWAGPSVSVPFNNNTGGTGTGFVTVTNDGQASTGFVMDFKATGSGTFHIVKDVPGPINPEIQIFGINNNDIIHIDTRYGGKTVQVNGVTRWDLVAPNSNFFELDQGDNVILCEQVHNTGTITFNPKYIGF